MMRRPTSVEPVNAVLSTSGLTASSSPAVPPGPATMFTTPGGMSASWKISPSISAVIEVNDAGLMTAQLPAASDGAIFHAAMMNGKFHGMIPVVHAVRLVALVVGGGRERRALELDLVGLLDRRSGRTSGTRPAPPGMSAKVAFLIVPPPSRASSCGELLGVGLDELGDLVQLRATLGAGHLGPRALVERLAGGLDGALGIVTAGLGDLRVLGRWWRARRSRTSPPTLRPRTRRR